jgi:DNA-binding Xre family transcriptional regulator
MSAKHIHIKTERTPEELAEIRAVREYFQREKPSPDQLLAESGMDHFMTMGEYMFLHQVFGQLKLERERQNLTLAALEERTGISQATLSRLETGKAANPTIDSIYRIATALNKQVNCFLTDADPPKPKNKPAPAS